MPLPTCHPGSCPRSRPPACPPLPPPPGPHPSPDRHTPPTSLACPADHRQRGACAAGAGAVQDLHHGRSEEWADGRRGVHRRAAVSGVGWRCFLRWACGWRCEAQPAAPCPAPPLPACGWQTCLSLPFLFLLSFWNPSLTWRLPAALLCSPLPLQAVSRSTAWRSRSSGGWPSAALSASASWWTSWSGGHTGCSGCLLPASVWYPV